MERARNAEFGFALLDIVAAVDISVSYAVGAAQASAAVAGLRKFEGLRITVGLVVTVVATGFCYSEAGTTGSIAGSVCLCVFVVFVALSLNWLRILARVAKTANASGRPSTVTISEAGMSVARSGAPAAPIEWKDVVYCTNVAEAWVFSVKGRRNAVLVPHSALTPEQREQLTTFLGTWSKRRYRITSF